MELKWFGEHRRLIEKMVLYGNSYARTYKTACPRYKDYELSASEMQVMEYLLENEEKQENMLSVSQRLGISASSFTNVTAKLTKMGLLEKYHLENNKKAVIVLVSDLGKEIYEAYTKEAYEHWIEPVTHMLEGIPKQYIEKFEDVLEFSAKVSTYPEMKKKCEKAQKKAKLMPMNQEKI